VADRVNLHFRKRDSGQRVHDATLIRHAYVLTSYQTRGIGAALLSTLVGRSSGQLLVGTWATAEWAIRFYERNRFHLVSTLELRIACLAHAERFLSDNESHRWR
jgi:GNAT superfamily N-acetyltransferase